MSATVVTVRPIPRHEWPSTLQTLADGHRVNIEVDRGNGAAEIEAAAVPLRSMTFEDGDDQIAIAVGGRADHRDPALWHYVDAPQHIRIAETAGRPHAIAITAGGGARTIVRFYTDDLSQEVIKHGDRARRDSRHRRRARPRRRDRRLEADPRTHRPRAVQPA